MILLAPGWLATLAIVGCPVVPAEMAAEFTIEVFEGAAGAGFVISVSEEPAACDTISTVEEGEGAGCTPTALPCCWLVLWVGTKPVVGVAESVAESVAECVPPA